MNKQQIAEIIELRKQDMGLVPIARKLAVGVRLVRDVLTANGISTQTTFQKIAWCIKAHPDWDDTQVAAHAKCHASIVEERRTMILKNKQARDRCDGVTLNQRLDRGPKFRVCRRWLRANCSKGERTIDQISAIFGVAHFPLTLAEVRESCRVAGLAVDRSGSVSAPAKIS